MTEEGPEVVDIRAGATFVIAPATGYTWQEEHDPSLLELLRANDFRAASDAVGAGGTETFEFRSLKPGETESTLATSATGRIPAQSARTGRNLRLDPLAATLEPDGRTLDRALAHPHANSRVGDAGDSGAHPALRAEDGDNPALE